MLRTLFVVVLLFLFFLVKNNWRQKVRVTCALFLAGSLSAADLATSAANDAQRSYITQQSDLSAVKHQQCIDNSKRHMHTS